MPGRITNIANMLFLMMAGVFILVKELKAVSDAPGSEKSEAIVFYYFQRPPYYFTGSDGKPDGMLLKPVIDYLKKAPFDIRAIEVKSDGILHRIKANRRKVCSVGWFKNSERAKFAKFTKPIYVNKPLVVLTTLNHKKEFSSMSTLGDIFRQKDLRWGVVENFSYGSYVDDLSKKLNPQIISSNDQVHMIKMLIGRRFSYMLIAPEEVEELIRVSAEDKNSFYLFSPGGMPEGNSRYILCSKMVSNKEINTLNQILPMIQ